MCLKVDMNPLDAVGGDKDVKLCKAIMTNNRQYQK